MNSSEARPLLIFRDETRAGEMEALCEQLLCRFRLPRKRWCVSSTTKSAMNFCNILNAGQISGLKSHDYYAPI
jgi:hypothetical protein